jgi:hypothetical protein
MPRRTSKKSRISRRRNRVPRNMSTEATVTRMYSADIVRFAADSGLYRTFQLLLFPVADLQGLYSQYRIRNIKIEYQLYNQLNNNSQFPTLFIAPQSYNEGTTPASLSEVQQFRNVRTFQFGPSRPTYSQSFVPYVNMVTTGPGRVPTRSPWLTTSGDAIQHLTHVDWLVNYNSVTAPTHTIRLVATAVIDLKNTR